MSSNDIDQKFRNRADAMIAVANKQCHDTPTEEVSASLLYAAARFGTFSIGSSAKDVVGMKEDKDAAVQFLLDRFENMLVQNFDEFIENFDRYTSNE